MRMTALVVLLMVGCGGDDEGHPSSPVDPYTTEVLAHNACIAMESSSNLLQHTQSSCIWELQDLIPAFSDSFVCWAEPTSWGQRCLNEGDAREAFAHCVLELPECEVGFSGTWYRRAQECVHIFRRELADPSCDVFPYVP